jgi:hypothetical protein
MHRAKLSSTRWAIARRIAVAAVVCRRTLQLRRRRWRRLRKIAFPMRIGIVVDRVGSMMVGRPSSLIVVVVVAAAVMMMIVGVMMVIAVALMM